MSNSNPGSLEALAQELASKTGKPIEVCRAGLALFASYMGEAVNADKKAVAGLRHTAQRILDSHYKNK